MKETELIHEKVISNSVQQANKVYNQFTKGSKLSNVYLTSQYVDEDVNCNLGHMHTLAGQHLDAITVYQLALKASMYLLLGNNNVSKGKKSEPEVQSMLIQSNPYKVVLAVSSISECLGLCYLKTNQFKEAHQVLCRSLYYEPRNQATYFNIAYIMEEFGHFVLVKKNKQDGDATAAHTSITSVKEVEQAIASLQSAVTLYNSLVLNENFPHPEGIASTVVTSYSHCYLKHVFLGSHTKRLMVDVGKTSAHQSYCQDNINTAHKLLRKARMEEERIADSQQALALEAQKLLLEKQQKQAEEQLLLEQNKKSMQEKALEKEKYLQKLQENWAAIPTKKEKKERHMDRSGNNAIYDSDEDEDAVRAQARELKQKQRESQGKESKAEESSEESELSDSEVSDVSEDAPELSDHEDDNLKGLFDSDDEGNDKKKQASEKSELRKNKLLRKQARKEKKARRAERKLAKEAKRSLTSDSKGDDVDSVEKTKKRKLLKSTNSQSSAPGAADDLGLFDSDEDADATSTPKEKDAVSESAANGASKRRIVDDDEDDEMQF